MRRILMLGALLILAAGCADESVRAVQRGGSAPDGLAASVSFCRRVGSKTGKRIETGDAFPVREGSKYRYVYGFLDLENPPVGRDLQVHLVWIRPDGRELFRRYGVVRVEPAESGWRTAVEWRDAEDLHDAETEEPVLSDAPAVALNTRLDVRPERGRDLGRYVLRAYLDRQLLAEGAFVLEAPDS